MADRTENLPTQVSQVGPHEVEVEDQTFEELGVDPRLIRALNKKNIDNPTPIQRVAIPLILEGKDVVARAKTGSGKTFAYLLPVLQKLFSDSSPKSKLAPSVFILVPTRELCQQVYAEVSSLIELCRVQLKVAQLSINTTPSNLRIALAGPPDILVTTPACIPKCLSSGFLKTASITDSLEMLVLDEDLVLDRCSFNLITCQNIAKYSQCDIRKVGIFFCYNDLLSYQFLADLLLSYGYEEDLKALTAHVPRRCQCLLMSATSSSDVEKLKKLILHNPYILTLPEMGEVKDDIIPQNVQQFWLACGAHDKLVYILAILKLELIQKKVLIYTNTIDMGFRLRLFLEKFGIRSAVLNAELPQNSRLHILEEFNVGLFDYLIATDETQTKENMETKANNGADTKKSRKHAKAKLDSEFGVVRGIDFKNVHTVINFDMPLTIEGYVHRIGRTGRGYNTGASVSLVSPNEMNIFNDIKSYLGDEENKEAGFIAPFPLLTKSAVESLRYRVEDVAKSVTKVAVREARAQDLRNEILNSEKLKAHFESNPKDLDLLKHDKVLSKKPLPLHLREVPEYLLDATTREASKLVKLQKAAMGNNKPAKRQSSKKTSRKSKNPLKTFSAEVPKKAQNGGIKRKGKDGDDNHKRKKQPI